MFCLHCNSILPGVVWIACHLRTKNINCVIVDFVGTILSHRADWQKAVKYNQTEIDLLYSLAEFIVSYMENCSMVVPTSSASMGVIMYGIVHLINMINIVCFTVQIVKYP